MFAEFIFMKADTPITNAIELAATDDTGCVCRMELIWEGLEKLERENARLRAELARIAALLKKWNAPGTTKDQLGLWDEIEVYISENVRDHRCSPEAGKF
jgi:hypothetical protein